jgi:hypothetical protein
VALAVEQPTFPHQVARAEESTKGLAAQRPQVRFQSPRGDDIDEINRLAGSGDDLLGREADRGRLTRQLLKRGSG